jgi:predicted amidohydrolase
MPFHIPGGTACDTFRQAAARHGLYVCAGLVERCGERLFNAGLLIDPRGEILLHHRKLHELDFARKLYDTGNRLGVAETPWGPWGLMICSDAFAPGLVIGRTLGWMGARLILSPCAWAVPPDHDNTREPYGQLWRESYGPVSREFGCTIAGCSHVGVLEEGAWRGRRCIGNSLVLGPEGQTLAQGPFGQDAECLVEVTLNLAEPATGPS